MCEICLKNPCDTRCPNYAGKIRGECLVCKEPLYENEYYYTDIDGNTFCSEECAKDYNGIKEAEWD